MNNIGHHFYKEYFNNLSFNVATGIPAFDGKSAYSNLKKHALSNYSNCTKYFENKLIKDENKLNLTTTYPGLLIGSGYIHEIGGEKVNNELKLGFFFDHTTGLPLIPASSVKGLLRSAFKKVLEKDEKGNKASLYVQELLETITKKEWSLENISKLEKSIFEGEEGKSIYKRDIFFDAFPTESKNDNSIFLANDYITPHENPLKNPNPIQFLKVLPNVSFQFNFDLKENGGLTVEQKTQLFKLILLDMGIGAKTNVGYGQFVDESSNNENTRAQPEESINLNPDKNILIEGDTLKAIITSFKSGIIIDFGFKVSHTTKIINVSPSTYKVGQIIDVKVIKKGKYLGFNIINPST